MAIKFHAQGVKELLLKAGRSTEKARFKRLLKKYPGSGVKAYKVAQQKGLRKTFALGQKMGVEGLGVRAGIKKITKFKPSKSYKPQIKDRPLHFTDPNFAYKDMPQIVGRASAEAKETMNQWGMYPRNRKFFKVKERISTGPVFHKVKGKNVVKKYKGSEVRMTRKKPQYLKHRNLSQWIKSNYKTYKD